MSRPRHCKYTALGRGCAPFPKLSCSGCRDQHNFRRWNSFNSEVSNTAVRHVTTRKLDDGKNRTWDRRVLSATKSECGRTRRNGETRSTGTVQTSAKARLTSAAILRISMNECLLTTPYLPIVTNPENNPCIQTVTRIATEI